MRPISLSNFSNKIFSRLIHKILIGSLTDIVSLNQAGFVKGRSIMENVLLTQEIVSDIRLRTKYANVVMKLDMAKAYDRVSWIFLMKVLRKIGFLELVIDMIFRLISSNWYSVLVNGQQYGFFQSSRGVNLGDPLSPTLFILTAEVLSRNLNALSLIPQFKGYGMPKWSPKVNHLSYADDMIIVSSANVFSLHLIMEVLKK
ncbi:secreted RxLR effector protein 78-like [Lycium barbarum]|uniref:secreted RxLR effector protein 78-like n=1 Tax=Lycium barbarum TaxID=112863 RepID=UPI00293E0B68|nr:secreted RxLR effector protein 78-like [Lycium barbarum]